MKPYWEVFACEQLCGCPSPHPIPAGGPVRVIAPAVYRCSEHSPVPFNAAAADELLEHRIDVELAELRRRARARESAPAESGPGIDVEQLVSDVAAMIGHPQPPRRLQFVRVPRRSRPLKPFRELHNLPFDPKAAAVGGDL